MARVMHVRNAMAARVFLLTGFLACTLFGATGCSKSDAPETAVVEGKVTINGQPLPKIGVSFFPEGPGPMASGNTDENGVYSLTTINPNDGASIGMHRVAFGAAEESESQYARKALPSRYGSPETSNVTAEVIAGQVNTIDFDLKK